MTGLLDGKRILVAESSPTRRSRFIARVAQEQGAQLVLTGFDRLRLIQLTGCRQRPPLLRTRRAKRGAPGPAWPAG